MRKRTLKCTLVCYVHYQLKPIKETSHVNKAEWYNEMAFPSIFNHVYLIFFRNRFNV